MSNKKEKLEKLLNKWKKHLIKKKAPYAGSLFRPDGFICDNIDDFDGILIIGKESNSSDDYKRLEKEGIKENDVIKTEPCFWFKNVVDDKDKDSDSKFVFKSAILHECIKYCIEKGVNDLDNAQKSEVDHIIERGKEYKKVLKNSAFMNYKKVGGKEKSNTKELIKWSRNYETEKFIVEEIGIISPSAVIIYGESDFYERVSELIEDYAKKYNLKIFWSYHPSYPKLNNLENLVKQKNIAR